MKKALFTILSLCITLGMVQCKSESSVVGKNEVVNIEQNFKDSVEIGELFDDVEFIKLSNKEPVGMVCKTMVYDDKIYVSDGKSLKIFNRKGDYLQKLEHVGRAKNEYKSIADFTIADNDILLLDINKKLLRYRVDDLKFVNSCQLDMFAATVYILNKDDILLTSAYQSYGDKFHIFDMESLERKGSFKPINENHITYRHFMFQQNFYKYRDAILYFESVNNTISVIDQNGITPRYNLNFYNKNLPDDIINGTYNNVMEFYQKANGQGYCYGTPIFAESDNSLLFTFISENGYIVGTYDKASGKSNQYSKVILDKSLNAVPVGVLDVRCYDSDNVVMTISSNFIRNSNNSDAFPNVEKDDNPVVCIAKIK